MNCFDWTCEIGVGHPEIDRQHKRLFLLGEAVVESLTKSDERKVTVAQLQGFNVFALEHFKYEEGLMRSTSYPKAEQHARDHALLLTELIVECENVHWGRNINPEGLTSFLWNWLILHIDIADRELVAWLKSHENDVTDALLCLHLPSEQSQRQGYLSD